MHGHQLRQVGDHLRMKLLKSTCGAFDAQSGQGEWRLICRDSMFDIMFMAVGSVHGLADTLHAETTALSYDVV